MNIFGMGPMEIMLILILGLIVLGPGRLPEVVGQVGKAVRDFRRATSELSEEFNRTIQSEIDETKAAIEGTPTIAPPSLTQSLPPPAPPPPLPHTNGVAAEAPVTPAHAPNADTAEGATAEVAPGEARPARPAGTQHDDLQPPY